jgi:hypothetical protein
MAVFWVVALCSLVKVYRRFRGACCLHYQGEPCWLRRSNSEDSHLHTRRRENLKFYMKTSDLHGILWLILFNFFEWWHHVVLGWFADVSENLALLNSKKDIERHGRVVSTPASCPEGPSFKNWLGDRLSWLRFFVVFLGPSTQMLR